MMPTLFPLEVIQMILATVQWNAIRVSKAFQTAMELQFHTCRTVWSHKRDIESVGDYPWFWRWVVFEAEDSLLLPLWGPTLIKKLKDLHYDETLKHINSIAELDVLYCTIDAAEATLSEQCVLSKAALHGQMENVISVLFNKEYQIRRLYRRRIQAELRDEKMAMCYAFEVGWVHWVKVCLEYECCWDAEMLMPDWFADHRFSLEGPAPDINYLRQSLRWRCFLLLATRLDLCLDFDYLCQLLCSIEALRVDFTWPKSLILALEERRVECATLQRFLETANVECKQVGSVPVL